MTFLQAVFLGLVQGLTEFLPISSSGHLVIAQKLLGFEEAPVAFDIYLHLATLAVVIYFFRHSIRKLNRRLILILLLSTIPAVLFGLFLNSYIDLLFTSLLLTSLGFLVSSLFVFLSDRTYPGNIKLFQITPRKSLFIGLFQAIAIIPSISRSGATIYAGLKFGLKRETAITFAYLMSVPAVFGAVAYEWLKLTPTSTVPLIPTLAGMLTAFVSGLFSLQLMKKLVIKSHLAPFGWYCLILAIVTLIWSF